MSGGSPTLPEASLLAKEVLDHFTVNLRSGLTAVMWTAVS
jgi:hypothetical protein